MKEHTSPERPEGPASLADHPAPQVVGSTDCSLRILGTPVSRNWVKNSPPVSRTRLYQPVPPLSGECHSFLSCPRQHTTAMQATQLHMDVGYGPRPPTPPHRPIPVVTHEPPPALNNSRVTHGNPAVPVSPAVACPGPPRTPPDRHRAYAPRMSDPPPTAPRVPQTGDPFPKAHRGTADQPPRRLSMTRGPHPHTLPPPRDNPPRTPARSLPRPASRRSQDTYPTLGDPFPRPNSRPLAPPAGAESISLPLAPLPPPTLSLARGLTAPQSPGNSTSPSNTPRGSPTLPSLTRGTGRQHSRKQQHPQHLPPSTVRRPARTRKRYRPPSPPHPGPPSRAPGPSGSPHPPPTPAPPPPGTPSDLSITAWPAAAGLSPSLPPRVPTSQALSSGPPAPTPLSPPHPRYLARACKARAPAATSSRRYEHSLNRGGWHPSRLRPIRHPARRLGRLRPQLHQGGGNCPRLQRAPPVARVGGRPPQ